MAIAFVQGTGNFASGAGATLTAAYGSNVTAGNLLIVAGYSSNASVTPTLAVSDTQGNAWTSACEVSGWGGTPQDAQIFYAIAKTTGANTVTLTTSGSDTFRRVCIHEYSGCDTLDQVSTNTGASGTTVSSGNVTTTVAAELLFGWMISGSGVTSAGSGETLRQTEGSESTMDQVVSSTGSYAITAPTSDSDWAGLIATFYAAGPPGADLNLYRIN